jgi:hypothetical protein
LAIGHEVQHHDRHIERILQERPEPPDRHQLQGEPELHVLTAAALDQRPVLLIEEDDLGYELARAAGVGAHSHGGGGGFGGGDSSWQCCITLS